MSFFARHSGALRGGDLADALFKDSTEGLALLDRSGAVQRVNPSLTTLLSVVPGGRLWAALPPQIAPALEAALQARRAASLTAALDTPERHLVLRFTLLPVRHGAALLRVADQTELQARLDAQGQAQRLQAVGSLAGGIAHDFNNLLTAIQGSVDDLAGRLTAEVDQEELRQIRDSAARGAALVRQVLAFSRQQTLQPRVISLNAAVRNAASLLRRLIGNQVRISLTLEEPERLVRIDPTQLDQVLVNLAVNASHAMPGGGTLSITSRPCLVIRARKLGIDFVPPGRYALLSVADTGKGIAPEILPRIFEPFFTTKKDSGGTGLGLATVYGIIHQSGGFMGVETAPDAGTCFEILLPRYEENWLGAGHEAGNGAGNGAGLGAGETMPARSDSVPSSAALPAAEPDGSAPLVLLVDDEMPVRRIAERALVRAGLRVLPAESAEDALDRLEAAIPRPRLAALVSDVVMPGMDGTALVRHLRTMQPGLPACLMSGYADAALRDALQAQDIVFIAKPFGAKDLARAVTAMLSAAAASNGETAPAVAPAVAPASAPP